MLKSIPSSLIIGNCLKSVRNGIYQDSFGREYSVAVSKHEESPHYSVRIVRITDVA